MHLYYAKTIAEDLVGQLQPFCDVINIAGSIRREKEDVKDIEIVAIPMRLLRESRNLFQEVTHSENVIHPEFDRIINSLGKVIKGKTCGRQMQIEIQRKIESISYMITIDLFMPQPHDYYRMLAIRTGSADYSKRFIAIPWIKKGWCGTEYGLRKICECYKVTESKWVMKKEFIDKPSLPPVWKSEEELFRWLGVQYLEPEQRNL